MHPARSGRHPIGSQAQRPIRRPDPRVRARSLTRDQFRTPASRKPFGTRTYRTQCLWLTRAREYQICRPKVKYSPVRVGGRKRSRLIDLLIHRQSTVRVLRTDGTTEADRVSEPVGAGNPDSSDEGSRTGGSPVVRHSRRSPPGSVRSGIRVRVTEKEVDVAQCSYAVSRYSWISPPSRSRRRTRSRSMTSAICCSSLAGSSLHGGRCPRARCGRCSLWCRV